MALPWTRGGEKQIGTIKRARDARAIRDLGHANEVKAQLAALVGARSRSAPVTPVACSAR